MANTTANNTTASTFISYELDKEQQSACKAWCNDPTEFDTMVLRTVEQDYKVSLRYDTRNKCFAAWLLPDGSKHINAGFIMPGRGSTPLRALKQACFKHWQIAKGDCWDVFNSGTFTEIDD